MGPPEGAAAHLDAPGEVMKIKVPTFQTRDRDGSFIMGEGFPDAMVQPGAPFRMRVHRKGREVLVAVSDENLVGREFKEGRLRLHVSETFYGTDYFDATEVLRHLAACTIANLVGVEVVTLAIQHGLVNPDSVIDIGGVPHAQLVTA